MNKISEILFNALNINGLPEKYEHFFVPESLNPASYFTELRTRLQNYKMRIVDNKETKLKMVPLHYTLERRQVETWVKPNQKEIFLFEVSLVILPSNAAKEVQPFARNARKKSLTKGV